MCPTVRLAIPRPVAGRQRDRSLGGGAAIVSLLLATLLGGCVKLPSGPPLHIDRDRLPTTIPELVTVADRAVARSRSVRVLAIAGAAMEKALAMDPTNPEALWRAARSYVYLAEQVKDRELVLKLAREARRLAELMVTRAPKRPEGYYYEAAAAGLLAQVHLAPGREVQEAVERPALELLELDPSYEQGGAMRILGALYVKAPTWPAGVGDVDEGLELLERAVREYPNHPLNHLFLAQALQKVGRKAEAIVELRKVLKFPPEGEWKLVAAPFRQDARQLLRDMNAL